MSVWVTVPSKRPPSEVKLWAEAWRDMGYRLSLWRDDVMWRGDQQWGWMTPNVSDPETDVLFARDSETYPGYAQATNMLIRVALNQGARWCVIGGDDVFPDTTKRADEIALECNEHFGLEQGQFELTGWNPSTDPLVEFTVDVTGRPFSTFGVMQPTGDRWAEGQWGFTNAPIDRVAGSAWIGREFALRAYGGNGPLWPEYFHMFPDEELQCVAEKLGVFWQRRDLTQFHKHWGRNGNAADMPAFLAEVNSREHWDKYKALFEARKAAGFPGHEVKI